MDNLYESDEENCNSFFNNLDTNKVFFECFNYEIKTFIDEINSTELTKKDFSNIQNQSPSKIEKLELEIENKNNSVPITEIILSSHLCLFIFTLIRNYSSNDEYFSKSRLDNCLKLLPNNSFLVPIRILKAYLTLQGNSGVLFAHNIRPILTAINAMESYQKPQINI